MNFFYSRRCLLIFFSPLLSGSIWVSLSMHFSYIGINFAVVLLSSACLPLVAGSSINYVLLPPVLSHAAKRVHSVFFALQRSLRCIATSSFSFFLFFFILCRSFALADTDEVDYKASKQQQADRVVRLPGQPLSTSATTPAT